VGSELHTQADLAALVPGVCGAGSVWSRVMDLCLEDRLPGLGYRATAVGSSEQGLAKVVGFCLIKSKQGIQRPGFLHPVIN